MRTILINTWFNIEHNIEHIYFTILCNIYVITIHHIAPNICQYCTYCTYCASYNTLYIFANIVQYFSVLYNICQYHHCSYKPILFIYTSIVQHMPVLYNICQYCSLLPERNACCCCFNSLLAAATSVLAASMLPVPLTVLLRYVFVTTIIYRAPPPPAGAAAPLGGAAARGTVPSRGASKGASIRFVVLGIVEQCTTS